MGPSGEGLGGFLCFGVHLSLGVWCGLGGVEFVLPGTVVLLVLLQVVVCQCVLLLWFVVFS